jgi:conjugative relaxase-like TrwC/TraI family protein
MMRVTTLQASAAKVEKLVDYYAGLAEDRDRPDRRAKGPVDYYLDPDEPPGRWWGAGRPALGVDSAVAGEELRALLEARHPVTRGKLGRGFGDKSARGFDATFSAPKSVSTLWAMSPDPWVRAEVLAAHDTAVDAALGWFEKHGAVTRRGTNGIHQVDTQGVTAALFRQHTSRSMDPQLHTHAIVSSKVQDPTGKWLALDARFLKYQQRTIGWIYDAALRSELTARLSVIWEPIEGGHADLTCIPEVVRDQLSRRTVQVEAKLAELIERWSVEHDGAEPEVLTIAMLERRAVRASRPAKRHGVDAAELHQRWIGEAMGLGFDPADLAADRLAEPSTPTGVDEGALVVEALRRVEEESSTWLSADIARHLATLLPPSASRGAAQMVEVIDRLAAVTEERCLALGPEHSGPVRRDGQPVGEAVTDRRFTTRAVLAQEQELQRWAQVSAYPTEQPTGDAQADAAAEMASFAPLVVVVGPAGTGKTHTTARAVMAIQDQDRPVVGLAPSGKAADVLGQEAGCPTQTLAAFLARHQAWPAGTNVILDEAGMAATADLAMLVGLAKRSSWRLIAVGDPAQLPAVGRGGVFAHWCETLHHHELETPRRFDHEWEADASLALRIGDPAAVDAYSDHQRLHASHPALLARQVALAHQHHVERGRRVAITTTTTAMASQINEAIQARQAHGIGTPHISLDDGTHVYAGDRIATRRNDPELTSHDGHQVRNRHTWTVEVVRADGSLGVSDPGRGWVGWAVTGYGNQGDTVDIGLAVLEPGTYRSHAYVAMTRGRTANHAWVPDPTGTTDPAEQLAQIIARTPNHESALATHRRLHHEAGIEPPDPETLLDRSSESGIGW